MSERYVSADDLAPAAIRAALDSGELRQWRRDSNGVQWYERPDAALPMIRGVSPEDEALQAEAEEAQAAIDLEIAEQELQAARERFAAFLNGTYGGDDEYREAGDE